MAGKGGERLSPTPSASPLERVLAAADELRDLHRIARAGIVYGRAIDAPNHREPHYIANRRDDLRDLVRAHDRKRRARRARSAVRRAA